ncbi:MAG: hypothetical protein ACI9FB_001908 [Candidatus Azotimanducaceae bacterium]|jgi:hypothetical protein
MQVGSVTLPKTFMIMVAALVLRINFKIFEYDEQQ